MNKNISTTQRINDLLHIDFKIEEHSEFWNFLILWNLFECRLFDTSFSIPKACDLNLCPTDEVLKTTLKYFQNRYVENGNTNSRFDKLEFRKGKNEKYIDKKLNVANILLGKQDEELTQTTAIQCIIYRLRNNLFHGIKSVESFPDQEDTFKIVNNFLLSCLESNK